MIFVDYYGKIKKAPQAKVFATETILHRKLCKNAENGQHNFGLHFGIPLPGDLPPPDLPHYYKNHESDFVKILKNVRKYVNKVM